MVLMVANNGHFLIYEMLTAGISAEAPDTLSPELLDSAINELLYNCVLQHKTTRSLLDIL